MENLRRGAPARVRMASCALVTALLCMAHANGQVSPIPGLAADFAVPVASVQDIRRAGTLIQQYDFSCGSAAVATLLTHHYGQAVTEREVFERMYARGDQKKIQKEGFSLLDMKQYLASRGFEADGFRQPLDKLKEERLPAIALIVDSGYHHFVVIKGLDAERVLVGDPAKGTRSIPRASFEASWPSRLLFVVHNRRELARFDLAADWRAAPRAPTSDSALLRESLMQSLPKHGPGQF
jgi:predicted double-glycine peptidase